MANEIGKQLEALAHASRSEIEALWAQYFGRTLKAPARRDFVVLLLAYRLQDRTLGGLTAAIRKRLRAIAAQIEVDPDADIVDTPRIRPGARLIREWQGKTHAVTVTEDGFAYNGKRFKSLSEIARLITGTRWSGPLFFGLKKGAGYGRREAHAD